MKYRHPLLAAGAAFLLCAAVASCTQGQGSAAVEDKAAAEVPCSQHTYAPTRAMNDSGIRTTSSLCLAPGRYALPATTAPTQLVVVFHGHLNDSCDWRRHLQQIAAHGAIAVGIDYSGQRQKPVENYGWRVREGAADSIAAAKYFLKQYPTLKQVIAFGISMGGNASGVAVASADAVRADGSPLFDYWVDIEGVNSLIEEYGVIVAVAPVNAGAALAQAEIEEENGGAFQDVPDKYTEIDNMARAPDMTGLKGAVVINAVDDGLVPTNQSPDMAAALNALGVPTHLFTVLLHGSGESGTTATAIVMQPVYDQAGQGPYESPFAGHGWEGSDTQLVIATGFEQLYALLGGDTPAPGETVVPGN